MSAGSPSKLDPTKTKLEHTYTNLRGVCEAHPVLVHIHDLHTLPDRECPLVRLLHSRNLNS